ncbi:PRTase-like protein [Basidiobolus meristosporus CBS 931.73]|uniref:PRTase-like protein n=1 Tax=Basidiobolus meristosporus CBS 931.73 TaxID=1314790 RepID=A0A1Y1Z6A0_9FUNG|nr:PRTase-like protein [Basidiobolus meristosporus CBS 931.73]|eukprot:ORY05781.1 PRTase-like protein [Basidiobolus meristosporus CBS 931.73]
MSAPVKTHISYNQIHTSIKETVPQILEFDPELLVAIGGGGFIPARILRTFLKKPNKKNIHIQAIGLSLYEEIEELTAAGEDNEPQVQKTQWLDFQGAASPILVGRRILIVDEVDDTRQTLSFAVRELMKDIEEQKKEHPELSDKETKIGIFVIHNKLKPKKRDLPEYIMKDSYFAAENVEDKWIVYPWDALDIEEHTRLSQAN